MATTKCSTLIRGFGCNNNNALNVGTSSTEKECKEECETKDTTCCTFNSIDNKCQYTEDAAHKKTQTGINVKQCKVTVSKSGNCEGARWTFGTCDTVNNEKIDIDQTITSESDCVEYCHYTLGEKIRAGDIDLKTGDDFCCMWNYDECSTYKGGEKLILGEYSASCEEPEVCVKEEHKDHTTELPVSWKKYEEKDYDACEEVYTAYDLEGCKNKCENDNACYAVDHKPTADKDNCYLNYPQNINDDYLPEFQASNDWNSYEKQFGTEENNSDAVTFALTMVFIVMLIVM